MPQPPFVTYLVSALPNGSWFVENDAGASGYSFDSLTTAERFAIALARRNRPSKVRIIDLDGSIVDETDFDEHGPS